MRPSSLLSVTDPSLALDLDMAIALRVHGALETAIEPLLEGDDAGAFFAIVVLLLRALT